VKVRPGEYAQAGPLATPLMLIGDVSKVHVRVDIDENDAWRVRRDAPAVATVRGNRDLKTNLRFVRIEPYVVPKKSLTARARSASDTRVLQVLYSFDKGGAAGVRGAADGRVHRSAAVASRTSFAN
jgi:multidrug resistance efflux pump